jgi:hypothetical protein
MAKPHVCDGEHCPGCPRCYTRTGEHHCEYVCEHAERCQDCGGRLNADYECPACDPEEELRECDRCGKPGVLITCTRQTARQTHWSPAEYEEADLCDACRTADERAYEREMERRLDERRGR